MAAILGIVVTNIYNCVLKEPNCHIYYIYVYHNY